MGKRTFMLDQFSVDWYDYLFNDNCWFANDIAWGAWRVALVHRLTDQQMAGKACALCGKVFTAHDKTETEYVGGFSLRTCLPICEADKPSVDPPLPEHSQDKAGGNAV